jgi:hypothetical protein
MASNSKARAFWCVHCLTSFDVKDAPDALKQGKAHDLICKKNPLVQHVKDLERRLIHALEVQQNTLDELNKVRGDYRILLCEAKGK